MRWREFSPLPMSRIAVVARATALRDALVTVADSGTVELDRVVPSADLAMGEAARTLQRLAAADPIRPCLSPTTPDLAELEHDNRVDLLAGEVELDEQASQAVVRDGIAAMLGWIPTEAIADLAMRLVAVGAAVAPLPAPSGAQPPTANRRGTAGTAFGPLVDTYAPVPYRDIDPTIPSGLAYAVMFGAMFGDVGHGALLVAGAVLLRFHAFRRQGLARLRPHALLIAAGRCVGDVLRARVRRVLRPDRPGRSRADLPH